MNVLRQAVADFYPEPHRFICITDDAAGLDSRVEAVALPVADKVPRARGRGSPSCYVRLWAFSREAAAILGPRVVSIDLDVVILDDLRPLFNRPGDFVAWSDPSNSKFRYQGGFWIMQTGTRTHVWDDFPGADEAYRRSTGAGLNGTDQGWMSYIMSDEAIVDKRDGIWKMKDWDRQRRGAEHPIRMVQMLGQHAPWGGTCKQRYPSLHEQWQRCKMRTYGRDVLYINTRNFRSAGTMYRRGEINENPTDRMIELGYVRAVKIDPPMETK